MAKKKDIKSRSPKEENQVSSREIETKGSNKLAAPAVDEDVTQEERTIIEEELLKLGELGPLRDVKKAKEKAPSQPLPQTLVLEKSASTLKNTGVVYLGHIPHGFFEDQMKGFFSQFGKVINLRLSRSKKTGRSRGYAFIQFESEEVAKIVEKTMHKYILCGKVLECKYVEPEKVHDRMFANSKRIKIIPWRSIDMRKHNRERPVEKKRKRAEKLLLSEEKKVQKLKALGIEYDFPGYKFSAEMAKKRSKAE